ncbi:hypothetical protein CERZMDRAFT_91999 [Cercospora zeae-maydis SCOH1-5]|uniref:Uncharacterized protein n=1 Tax=Cercospora zeae-maydis SCOH1-5 TaxID=717836 RepID=A0A6A6EZ50_9PEZI|nr:hypothetical protein CERZMDRAFT_91999 [Cercospora zeae-maydis SCOH1-5]
MTGSDSQKAVRSDIAATKDVIRKMERAEKRRAILEADIETYERMATEAQNQADGIIEYFTETARQLRADMAYATST